MKVFLADDSHAVLERIREMLSSLPEIEIIGWASDVPEALDSIRETKPEAVILDLAMPNGSGIEVLKTIKHERPETIVVVLTNYAFPQHRRRCVEAGADAFLDKSAEFAEIPQVLRRLGKRAGYIQESHASSGVAVRPESQERADLR